MIQKKGNEKKINKKCDSFSSTIENPLKEYVNINIYLFNVRWPGGIEGNESVRGVVQFTPDPFLVAFVINVLSSAVNAHKKCPVKLGRLSITKSS